MIKKRILSIDVNSGSEAEYYKLIHQHIEEGNSGYACFSNVHMLIEAENDDSFQKVVNNATFAFPDGFPVAKSFKFLYNISQERIAGMDFLPNFLKECNKKKYTVGFVGSTPENRNIRT